MSSSAVTLAGNACSHLKLQIPAWGRAWVDCKLTEAVALSGNVTLDVAGTTYAMHVVTGGVNNDGSAGYRLVAGKGGWGKDLVARGYANDAGVAVAAVLRDAAAEVGETLGALPTARLGPHFARAAAPASNLLNLLAPRAWYIDRAGVTQFGARPSANYAGESTLTHVDAAGGMLELAVESVAGLEPGVTVGGSLPATDIEISLEGQRLSARVYSSARTSRRLEAMRRIVQGLFPWLKYAGTYEFRVVTQAANRLNLQPARVSSGMSDLLRVPVRPGVSGFRATVTAGELVLVCFADNDPSRPQVIAHADADSATWVPALVELGDGGDFVALKSAVDNIQQNLDSLCSFNTPWGPTAPGNIAPAGAQSSSAKLKVL